MNNLQPDPVMEHVRAAVEARRQSSGLSDAAFEILATGKTLHPTLDELERQCESLRYALRYSSVKMILSDVRPSPLHGLVQRARAMLHEVILFYVNQLAMQQAAINRLHLQALEMAVAYLRAQAEEKNADTESAVDTGVR